MGRAADLVRSASTPRTALLALAQLLDEHDATIAKLAAQANEAAEWDQPWDDPEVHREAHAQFGAGLAGPPLGPQDLETELGDLDPQQRADVIAARRRLAEDSAEAAPEPAPPAVELSIGQDGTTAKFPAPTKAQAQQRARLLDRGLRLEGLQGLTLEQAEHAFLDGGPLWLHAYDRDFVLQQPLEVKRAMIADAEQTGFREAHNLGADILKVQAPGGVEY